LEDIQAIKQRFGIIGNAPALNYAINVAVQVADTDLSVLITGESGSGKESFSKIIHALSHRKHNKFIAINCGAIPEGTIDSELFGHEKGSFTGAHDARKGYFEEVNGGTIFLDEIGEMPVGTQARLLRVLESGEFIRVGASKVQKTDVRVVAATNVNLTEAVRNGKFREDLYYRLNTVPIFVPPLRERGNDILMLFRKFAADYAEKYRTKPVTLDESAKQALLNYHFPGNVRQLKNIADQVSLLENNGTPVSAETIRRYLPDTSPQRFPTVANMDNKNESNIERELLYKMLFDLKKEVGEMRQMLALLIKNSAFPAFVSGETQNNVNIFHEEPNNFQFYENPTFTAPVVKNNNPTIVSPAAVKNEAGIQDITPVVEEEVSLQIDKTEKELIIKALKKNRGKRKYAAADLGISERTLYRKIKQYDLENY
jgi:transcriptional regulator with PAS, ATPase and Fis domain